MTLYKPAIYTYWQTSYSDYSYSGAGAYSGSRSRSLSRSGSGSGSLWSKAWGRAKSKSGPEDR